jgi:hypothetical protein
MNMRLVAGALVTAGLIAVAVPSKPNLAQSKDPGLSASNSVAANALPRKHRYWRHQGGRHPHYGSRRIRTEQAQPGNQR